MSQVFISYRQTDEKQKKRVRAFAELLRAAGIDVILDQFVDDENPAGPSQRWAQWSADQASKTEYVLIIGTQAWFQCFEGTQPWGTGLGAAYEAGVIRQRIFEAAGMNNDIRVVLSDDSEKDHIPIELRGYPYFLADRDFEKVVRWLAGKHDTVDKPRTSIPHNLPSLQPFFGREEELKTIADALDPESRTWGALIDGPGGIGKTSLAIRAAYDAPKKNFKKIVFVSLKSRELDDAGERKVGGFLISGLAELLNELARELGHPDIAKVPEDQRPPMLVFLLRGTQTLLVLDNLESLRNDERDVVLTFVKRLPQGCKAILTSRVRLGSAGEELTLERLSESAALEMLARLAESNPALAKTSEDERRELYKMTGGKPLLMRWTVGQIGHGSCLTLNDAITYLRSCPEGNDPLEFAFGYLVEDFSDTETRVLCALTYFTVPARVEHISEVAGYVESDTDYALRSLVNHSLVLLSEELKTFVLVPLVADFLRKRRLDVVSETGKRLEEHVYHLAVENGYEAHERFHVLDAAWPVIAAALPCFLAGSNDRLQTVCSALFTPCTYIGRHDESLALNGDAEIRAVSTGDFWNAGWRAYQVGYLHLQRRQWREALAEANRVETHWNKAPQAGPRERAVAISLRGSSYKLADDSGSAIAAFREAVELFQTLDPQSADVANCLNSLADAERLFHDGDAAERDYREALRINLAVGNQVGVSVATGNLAELALNRKRWTDAEVLSREALLLAENIGHQYNAAHCRRLAMALLGQDKPCEALPYAQRAVELFTRLSLPELIEARAVLAEASADCEKMSTKDGLTLSPKGGQRQANRVQSSKSRRRRQ